MKVPHPLLGNSDSGFNGVVGVDSEVDTVGPGRCVRHLHAPWLRVRREPGVGRNDPWFGSKNQTPPVTGRMSPLVVGPAETGLVLTRQGVWLWLMSVLFVATLMDVSFDRV